MFLSIIGPANRAALRRLTTPMMIPSSLWQGGDGVRVTSPDWSTARVLACPSKVLPRDIEQNSGRWFGRCDEELDPAIEACFRLLGRRRTPLELVLVQEPGYLPGMLGDHGQRTVKKIEHYRRKHTQEASGRATVDVLWEGSCATQTFLRQEMLVRKSFDILDQQKL